MPNGNYSYFWSTVYHVTKNGVPMKNLFEEKKITYKFVSDSKYIIPCKNTVKYLFWENIVTFTHYVLFTMVKCV
jgi:hypothetical protein